MASRTLFEALKGYASSAPAGPGAEILGADNADMDAEPERTEVEFAAVLESLEAQLDADPQFVQKMADAFGIPPDKALLQERLREGRAIVAASQQSGTLGAGSGDWSAQEEALQPELLGVSEEFSDSYVADHVVDRFWQGLPRIDLEPKSQRFEDDSVLGVLGWLVFNGPEALSVPRGGAPGFPEQFGRIRDAQPFRRHGAGDEEFVYTLPSPADGVRTRVALFADFGTGLGHSRFIARQIEVDRFDVAVHLGDVYYTGTKKEYRKYFEEPLEGVLQNGTHLFVIPDNHDGYEGFHAYVDFLKRRLVQKGSYFAIETEQVQFIGVDTIWHSDRGRIQDEPLKEWLRARFAAGRAACRANILLTGHEPYSYRNTDLEKLNDDVLELADGRLDLWFWGNTHYGALFDKSDRTPYYGSCIGHGGYPYKKEKPKEEASPSAAPVLFVESGSRYQGSNVRKDRGMNGFCSFEIEPDGAIALHYRDWRGHERCTARFAKQASGALELASLVEDLSS